MKKILYTVSAFLGLLAMGYLAFSGASDTLKQNENKKPKTIYYNKIKLDQSIKVYNFTGKSYMDTLVRASLMELNVSEVVVVIIPLDKVSDDPNYVLEAYVENSMGNYNLFIRDCDRDEAPLIIIHECYHIFQYDRGDLRVIDDGIVYNNMLYPFDTPYEYRDFERMAFLFSPIIRQSVMNKLIPSN